MDCAENSRNSSEVRGKVVKKKGKTKKIQSLAKLLSLFQMLSLTLDIQDSAFLAKLSRLNTYALIRASLMISI